MAERVVSMQITDEERSIETVLRPQTLGEYVGQQIRTQRNTLNEGGIAVLANLFGLGHACGRIAFRALTTSFANAFRLTRLFGLHGHGPQPQ